MKVPTPVLCDPANRTIRYLRVSLTDACPMRCTYCRPSIMSGCSTSDPLTPAEIESLVQHLVERHGLSKVRLTGGEPTARRDLLEIIRRLACIDGLGEIVMTTNGLTLARQASALAEAGLTRLNVSLDTLDEQRFERITGVGGLQRVIAGLDAAERAGLTPLKINTVVVRGENDHELPDLVEFALSRSCEIRFIELMPMGPLAATWAQRYVPASEMRRTLDAIVESWQPLPRRSEAATRFRVTLRSTTREHGIPARANPEHGLEAHEMTTPESFARAGSPCSCSAIGGVVGFITPMSCDFCANCDRIRIAADGTHYPCLMDSPAGSVLSALRPRYDAIALDETLHAGLSHKRPVHPAQGVGVMIRIGG